MTSATSRPFPYLPTFPTWLLLTFKLSSSWSEGTIPQHLEPEPPPSPEAHPLPLSRLHGPAPTQCFHSCLAPGPSSPHPLEEGGLIDTLHVLLKGGGSSVSSLVASTNCCLQDRVERPPHPPRLALPYQPQAILASPLPPPGGSEPGHHLPGSLGH